MYPNSPTQEEIKKEINRLYNIKPSKFSGIEIIKLHQWLKNELVPYLKIVDDKLSGQQKFGSLNRCQNDH